MLTEVAKQKEIKTVALVGNPNSGKTSLFNQLTGMNQRTGNYPGITVAIKTGKITRQIACVDLPGAYSLHATAGDEYILTNVLLDPEDAHYPDLVVYVADVTQLEKQFLLFTQVRDLGFPMILVLNMMDLADRQKYRLNIEALEQRLQTVEVIPVSSRTGAGIDRLKQRIVALTGQKLSLQPPANAFYQLSTSEQEAVDWMHQEFGYTNAYHSLLCMHHHQHLDHHSKVEKDHISGWCTDHHFNSLRSQIDDTMHRFDTFEPILHEVKSKNPDFENASDKADRLLTHRFAGPLFFLISMVVVFQAVFSWATYPMEWIESAFGYASSTLGASLPPTWWSSLLIDGMIPGIAGILVFIPQIAILFFIISLMEESGYMARAVFMFDRIMQRFGLNGRSLISLISGGACAIPAILSTRSISNPKERLITILVTPFISCSARIPVYAVLVAFVIPPITVLGIFNAQGLVFMGLYALGILVALLVSLLLSRTMKSQGSSYLMIHLPEYKVPNLRNVGLMVFESVRSFILEAGKIILFISLILWVLSSYGPGQEMQKAETQATEMAQTRKLDDAATANLVASQKLEASYAGHIGKWMEPAIRPLGYDWKIGIALLTSFAAREVFVGTMATIYSLGSAEDELTIHDRMAKEVDKVTGRPRYDLPTALSLLLFYVLAMQCISTLAVVKKETGTWKWPVIQFTMMTGLAYLVALITYQVFS
ncbi:MAG: ferrous iron transport protein B [Saprospiraceae bacterium]|nr:ferrous iron transport protein B [Saprospiraceae bacterium]